MFGRREIEIKFSSSVRDLPGACGLVSGHRQSIHLSLDSIRVQRVRWTVEGGPPRWELLVAATGGSKSCLHRTPSISIFSALQHLQIEALEGMVHRRSGCSLDARREQEAEKIPVEPEPDNAGAGNTNWQFRNLAS